MLADFAEHEHEVQHCAVVGREHFARHNQRNSRRIRQNHVGVDLVLHILNADFLNLTVEFALEGLKRRHDHLRQRFKRVEHHVRQIVFNDELMDALGQFLQTHAVVEARILLVKRRDRFLDLKIAVVVAAEVAELTQQPHRLRVVDTEGEEEEQVVGARLFNDHAAVIQVLGDDRSGNAALSHRAVAIETRREERDLDRVKIHVLLIDVAEAMPLVFGLEFPAFLRADVFGLPHVEEPRIGFFAKALDFLTEANRTIDGFINQTAADIAAHHSGSSFR